jgi:hypothetical protein
MSRERASIFEDDNDLDVSSFAPREPRSAGLVTDKAAIERVAIAKGFKSREASPAPIEKKALDAPATSLSRVPRRFVTGRNRQLNLKVTDEAVTRFYHLADSNGWVLGEAFEMALDALERELSSTLGATRTKGRGQKGIDA